MQCLICKYAVLSKMQECMNYFESTAWGASMQFGQWCKIAERPKMQEWSTDLDASVQSAVWPKMQECRVQCGQRCKRAECSVAKDARMHPCQRCKRAVQCGLSCKNASLSCLPTSDGASPPPSRHVVGIFCASSCGDAEYKCGGDPPRGPNNISYFNAHVT